MRSSPVWKSTEIVPPAESASCCEVFSFHMILRQAPPTSTNEERHTCGHPWPGAVVLRLMNLTRHP